MSKSIEKGSQSMSVPNEKFKFKITQGENGTLLSLQGIIDEDSNLAPLLPLITGILTINFRQIKSVNSCGIRNWVGFLRTLEMTQVHYEECPPPIVRQINMVPSFLGGAQVDSIYIPYVCNDCEKEENILVKREQFSLEKNPLVAQTHCAQCKTGELSLNGQPKQFFGFTKKQAA